MKTFNKAKEYGVDAICGKHIDLIVDNVPGKYYDDVRISMRGMRTLNDLLGIYRSKQTETFHYILVSKSGQIEDHLAITSHMPNFCNVSKPNDETLKQVISRLEDKDLYLMVAHNHPSGNSTESSFDRELTGSLERSLHRNDGLNRFLGHIIFENNDFNCYRRGFDSSEHHWTKVAVKNPGKDPLIVADCKSIYIGGTDGLKTAAKGVRTLKNVLVFFSNSDRMMSGSKTYPISFFEKEAADVRAILTKDAVEFGAIGAFPVVTNNMLKNCSKSAIEIEELFKNHIRLDSFTDAIVGSDSMTEKFNLEAGANYYSFYRDTLNKQIDVTASWDAYINGFLFPPKK